jgi:hypothetical protein
MVLKLMAYWPMEVSALINSLLYTLKAILLLFYWLLNSAPDILKLITKHFNIHIFEHLKLAIIRDSPYNTPLFLNEELSKKLTMNPILYSKFQKLTRINKPSILISL